MKEGANPVIQDVETNSTGPLYRVTEVAGRPPASLNELIGATSVTVEGRGHEGHLVGTGVRAEQTVYFYEKESGSAGDTEAVWTFIEDGSGEITVEPPTLD